MSKQNTVLLSPIAKNANDLLVRGFYAEPLGFGRVVEVGPNPGRIGKIAVRFDDFNSGMVELSFDDQLAVKVIEHDDQITKLVKQALEFCGPPTIAK